MATLLIGSRNKGEVISVKFAGVFVARLKKKIYEIRAINIPIAFLQ